MYTIKYHIHARGTERYARYALINIFRLIHLGNIHPSDIIFSCTPHIYEHESVGLIQELGARINRYELHESPHGKFILVNEIFKRNPTCQTVVQLDADCCLTEAIQLNHVIESLREKCDIMSYPMVLPHAWSGMFRKRSNLWMEGFKFDKVPSQKARLDAFLHPMISANTDMVAKWQNAVGWIYGGFFIVNRSILDTYAWETMKLLTWLTACDESIVMLARYGASLGQFRLHHESISQSALPHRITPEEFSFEGRGFVHYAGDWYRLEHQANKAIIDEEYERISHIIAN